MTAREVMTLARAGELQQLSPTIKDSDEVVVGFINLAMVELYKRFQVKTDEAIITMAAGKTIYKLDGTDTDVAMGAPYMYLISAFGDDGVADYTMGSSIPLPINDESDPFSVNTPSWNEVQIPLVTPGSLISIIYAAKPTKLTTLTLDVELVLPEQYIEALLHYMGYRGHGAMDGNIQTESNTHYVRFEKACDKLRELGVAIAPDDIDMKTRVSDRGFV